MTIRRVLSVIIIFLILSAALAGCSGAGHDPRLERVAEAIDSSPADALSLLDSIDRESLGEKNRHYHGFLTVKARDKAYITHTSDSLILSVIGYYGKHDKDLYPEALYYGGRVYSDLGDFPTALRYFQQSLDLIPDDREHINLRGIILSQTGRLLNRLSLYDQAIPYIESSIELDRLTNDSTSEVYDLQLLGHVYMIRRDYPKAQSYFTESLRKSHYLPASFRAKSKMYLAAVNYYLGNFEEALSLNEGAIDSVSPLARNSALLYMSKIYHALGKPDSAYIYASQLVRSDDDTNKETGYQILLSQDVRNLLPADSIFRYLDEYVGLLEGYYNDNGNQLALTQQSLYNYQLHERKRISAESRSLRFEKYATGISIMVLVLLVIILYLKNKNKKNIIKLRDALDNIKILEQSLSDNMIIQRNTVTVAEVENEESKHINKSESELRKELQNRLKTLYDASKDNMEIPSAIMQSKVYALLKDKIEKGESVNDNDLLWDDLEKVILSISPDFKRNLKLLVGGRFSSYDYHTSLLIKCGISPTQLAKLCRKSKGNHHFP